MIFSNAILHLGTVKAVNQALDNVGGVRRADTHFPFSTLGARSQQIVTA